MKEQFQDLYENIFYYLSLLSMYEDLNAISISKSTTYYYYWM